MKENNDLEEEPITLKCIFFPSLKYLKRHFSDDALNVQLKDNFFLYEWAKKK